MQGYQELFIKLQAEIAETKHLHDQQDFKKQIIRAQLLCELILDELKASNEHTKQSVVAPARPIQLEQSEKTQQEQNNNDSIFDF